ncbi:hypothetical protein DLAC_09503 [Tieghemostelium lacteum]|uniref:Uncharacterized protein n=1 Tax=Tieghemostelium lacteum TaxID=361077 RepID=A0A151Z6Z3_TIELA|nr:hypothetical protein DLAC_09503 [Tieghemostelium lacteum]|eukprot:KYQ89554.1 hypothetical protein DLAC_09503 [Tieghemostelium lacteum]
MENNIVITIVPHVIVKKILNYLFQSLNNWSEKVLVSLDYPPFTIRSNPTLEYAHLWIVKRKLQFSVINVHDLYDCDYRKPFLLDQISAVVPIKRYKTHVGKIDRKLVVGRYPSIFDNSKELQLDKKPWSVTKFNVARFHTSKDNPLANKSALTIIYDYLSSLECLVELQLLNAFQSLRSLRLTFHSNHMQYHNMLQSPVLEDLYLNFTNERWIPLEIELENLLVNTKCALKVLSLHYKFSNNIDLEIFPLLYKNRSVTELSTNLNSDHFVELLNENSTLKTILWSSITINVDSEESLEIQNNSLTELKTPNSFNVHYIPESIKYLTSMGLEITDKPVALCNLIRLTMESIQSNSVSNFVIPSINASQSLCVLVLKNEIKKFKEHNELITQICNSKSIQILHLNQLSLSVENIKYLFQKAPDQMHTLEIVDLKQSFHIKSLRFIGSQRKFKNLFISDLFQTGFSFEIFNQLLQSNFVENLKFIDTTTDKPDIKQETSLTESLSSNTSLIIKKILNYLFQSFSKICSKIGTYFSDGDEFIIALLNKLFLVSKEWNEKVLVSLNYPIFNVRSQFSLNYAHLWIVKRGLKFPEIHCGDIYQVYESPQKLDELCDYVKFHIYRSTLCVLSPYSSEKKISIGRYQKVLENCESLVLRPFEDNPLSVENIKTFHGTDENPINNYSNVSIDFGYGDRWRHGAMAMLLNLNVFRDLKSLKIINHYVDDSTDYKKIFSSLNLEILKFEIPGNTKLADELFKLVASPECKLKVLHLKHKNFLEKDFDLIKEMVHNKSITKLKTNSPSKFYSQMIMENRTLLNFHWIINRGAEILDPISSSSSSLIMFKCPMNFNISHIPMDIQYLNANKLYCPMLKTPLQNLVSLSLCVHDSSSMVNLLIPSIIASKSLRVLKLTREFDVEGTNELISEICNSSSIQHLHFYSFGLSVQNIKYLLQSAPPQMHTLEILNNKKAFHPNGLKQMGSQRKFKSLYISDLFQKGYFFEMLQEILTTNFVENLKIVDNFSSSITNFEENILDLALNSNTSIITLELPIQMKIRSIMRSKNIQHVYSTLYKIPK